MTRLDWALVAVALAFAAALGWFCRDSAIEDCAALVNSDRALCVQLGGNLDDDEDGPPVCLFTCSYPP